MDPVEISALGAAGSALLAALAYCAKANHERRRVTRSVVYYLLELHHVVAKVSIVIREMDGILSREISKVLSQRGVDFNKYELEAAIKAALPEIIRFAHALLEKTIRDTAEGYAKALSDLARENPVLAFQLRGREHTAVFFNEMSDFLKKTANDFPDDAAQIFLKGFFASSAEQDLRRFILKALWGCDVITHYRASILVRNNSRLTIADSGIWKVLGDMVNFQSNIIREPLETPIPGTSRS